MAKGDRGCGASGLINTLWQCDMVKVCQTFHYNGRFAPFTISYPHNIIRSELTSGISRMINGSLHPQVSVELSPAISEISMFQVQHVCHNSSGGLDACRPQRQAHALF